MVLVVLAASPELEESLTWMGPPKYGSSSVWFFSSRHFLPNTDSNSLAEGICKPPVGTRTETLVFFFHYVLFWIHYHIFLSFFLLYSTKRMFFIVFFPKIRFFLFFLLHFDVSSFKCLWGNAVSNSPGCFHFSAHILPFHFWEQSQTRKSFRLWQSRKQLLPSCMSRVSVVFPPHGWWASAGRDPGNLHVSLTLRITLWRR